MARRQKHWIWELYLALAAEGGRTEAQGRQAIKDLVPSMAALVDSVIYVQGRTDQLEETLANQWNETAATEEAALTGDGMNRAIRDYARRQDGTFAKGGDSESSTSDQTESDSPMNQRIRNRKTDLAAAMAEGDGDVNKAIRRMTAGE